MEKDNWSPFYPTVIYPVQEGTSLQRKMSSDLQTIVRDLSRIGQSQPQTQIVQMQSGDQDTSYQIGASINDLRESLGRDLGGLRNELGDFSSRLEWSIGLLHESIVEQTDVLLTIAKQQRIPTELKVSEYLTGAQEMVSQLAGSIQSGRLDQNQIKQSFIAIDDRFLEAMKPLPRASLMYAILLARAELYLLVKKYDEALVFLEEGLIYAPKEGSFDYISYSCRLIGRIVFALGDTFEVVHNAISCLTKAVKHSPDYAIAWYDLAQYTAQLSGDSDTDPALQYLRKAIELEPNFLVLASIESNFDPIRKDVDVLIQTIKQEKADDLQRRTDELRESHLAVCDQLRPQIEKIRASLSGGNFCEKERLGKELGKELGKVSIYSYPTINWSWDNAVINVLNLRDRVLVCKGLAELQAISFGVNNLASTVKQLSETVEALKKCWKDLSWRVNRYLEEPRDPAGQVSLDTHFRTLDRHEFKQRLAAATTACKYKVARITELLRKFESIDIP